MSRPRVAIAHDYLTQRGGAERVVLSMLKAFPDAPVYTTLYDPDGTYPEFRDATIITSPLNRVAMLRRDHRMALPLLAPASQRLRVDADVTVVSSSGWAHGFDITGRSLVYCYSPARWLYDSERYLGGPVHRSPTGLALLGLRAPLSRWDKRAASKRDRYLAISEVVRERIASTYDIDADVVPAPHSMDPTLPTELIPELANWAEEGYVLVVSRLLPYKNVDTAIEAVRGTDRRLVIIGRGPEAERLSALAPGNVRLLSGLTDAQMRWAYAHASLLLAPSHEDFGLTPLEACAFGVPVVALRAGGYLDTMIERETCEFFDAPSPIEIRDALHRGESRDWDVEALRGRAEDFSEARFVSRLRDMVEQLA